MIEFNELKIKNGEALSKDKWNGLLEWVVENPLNLTDSDLKLQISAREKLKIVAERHSTVDTSAAALAVHIESDTGANSKRLMAITSAGDLILSARTNPNRDPTGSMCRALVDFGNLLSINHDNDFSKGVKISGSTLMVNKNQDANGDTLILGPISQSNLRLGYHSSYSWIQSHRKHLVINPKGHNVGIGLTVPKATLDVDGTIKAKFYSYTGNANDKLIQFKTFSNLGDNVNKNTGFRSSDWNAAIVGFRSGSGDIQENGVGTIFNMFMLIRGGVWHIDADIRSHRTHENWTVHVMFVRKEISRRV